MKLTENEAKELLENVIEYQSRPSNILINDTIEFWKNKGWIEKTAFEELQEYYKKIEIKFPTYNFLQKLYDLALKAIEEVKNENR